MLNNNGTMPCVNRCVFALYWYCTCSSYRALPFIPYCCYRFVTLEQFVIDCNASRGEKYYGIYAKMCLMCQNI